MAVLYNLRNLNATISLFFGSENEIAQVEDQDWEEIKEGEEEHLINILCC